MDLDFMAVYLALRACVTGWVGEAGTAGATGRSTIAFRNFNDAISRLSISAVVLDSRNMCDSSNVIATPKPDAVLFIATEIASDNRLAFSAGLAEATALNAPIRPVIVPSRPIKSPILAS